MDRRKLVTLTNLCMITKGDEILVIDRQKKDWPGITFPGGHVENDESIVDSVIREVKEETGLDIQSPKLCGVKDWVNSDGSRYIVFLYTCNSFTGEIISSSEGKVSWVKREDFLKLKLSVDMDVLIRVFEDPELTEFYYQKVNEEWNIPLKLNSIISFTLRKCYYIVVSIHQYQEVNHNVYRYNAANACYDGTRSCSNFFCFVNLSKIPFCRGRH